MQLVAKTNKSPAYTPSGQGLPDYTGSDSTVKVFHYGDEKAEPAE